MFVCYCFSSSYSRFHHRQSMQIFFLTHASRIWFYFYEFNPFYMFAQDIYLRIRTCRLQFTIFSCLSFVCWDSGLQLSLVSFISLLCFLPSHSHIRHLGLSAFLLALFLTLSLPDYHFNTRSCARLLADTWMCVGVSPHRCTPIHTPTLTHSFARSLVHAAFECVVRNLCYGLCICVKRFISQSL